MRRAVPLLCLLLAGCSNAPIAGFLDTCFPSRARANSGPGIDVGPRPPADPIRPGPRPPGPDAPVPPPDLGPGAPPAPGN